MHIQGASALFRQCQAPVPLGTGLIPLLEAGVQPSRPPVDGESPARWAYSALFPELLGGGDSLDTLCQVFLLPKKTLYFTFVRSTYEMEVVHLHHLPLLYQRCKGVLGSVLYHLTCASDPVWPVYTPLVALGTRYPYTDLTSRKDREAQLWDLVQEHIFNIPQRRPSIRRMLEMLREEGIPNPVDDHAALQDYLADEPLSLTQLESYLPHCPHLAGVLPHLERLTQLAAQVPRLTDADHAWQDLNAHQSSTGQGFGAATFVSPRPVKREEHQPCPVEQALDDWGDLCNNTGFAPHYAVQVRSMEDAVRLRQYLTLAPQIQRLTLKVLKALEKGG